MTSSSCSRIRRAESASMRSSFDAPMISLDRPADRVRAGLIDHQVAMLQILDEDRVGRAFDHRLLAPGHFIERFGHLVKDAVQFGNLVVAGERRRQLLARRQADRVVAELLQAPADAAAEQERAECSRAGSPPPFPPPAASSIAATTRRGSGAALARPGVPPPARSPAAPRRPASSDRAPSPRLTSSSACVRCRSRSGGRAREGGAIRCAVSCSILSACAS